jgi:predicted LPLAT superfamily acyltransferase
MTSQATSPTGWRQTEEVGSLWGVRFVGRLANKVGRPAARAFLWIVTLYFFVTRPDRVAHCREFRRRAGASDSSWEVFLHMLSFAHCSLDRLYFLSGRSKLFRVYRKGHEHIRELRREKRGAMFLGCHLGSFEALRAVSRDFGLPLYIVADFHNARRLNAILDLFGDNQDTRFLDAGGDRVTMALKVREIIQAGGVVAILADRAGHGRVEEVPFLGSLAPFPVGPYVLAAHSKCPVYLTTGFYTAPNRYEILCERLFDRVDLPRKGRTEALRDCAKVYAGRLEHYAKQMPDNWFNFYSFWSDP